MILRVIVRSSYARTIQQTADFTWLPPTTQNQAKLTVPVPAGFRKVSLPQAVTPNLKLIQKIGVGVNTINLEAAVGRGIPVCNLPGTNARAVAELTLALMLATLRRVPRFDAGLRAGVWLDPLLQDGIGKGGIKILNICPLRDQLASGGQHSGPGDAGIDANWKAQVYAGLVER